VCGEPVLSVCPANFKLKFFSINKVATRSNDEKDVERIVDLPKSNSKFLIASSTTFLSSSVTTIFSITFVSFFISGSGQPEPSTLVPEGVSGHLSNLLATPSPSSSFKSSFIDCRSEERRVGKESRSRR